MPTPIDPTVLDQLKAAQDSAKAAWAAVVVYQWGLWATAFGVALNAVIALVAVRGPERERQIRDLEDRKQRTRLYVRAALAGLRGLSGARSLRKYLAAGAAEGAVTEAQTLAHNLRRLDVRRRVIEHFIHMELRDLNLVGWLFETSVLLRAVHDAATPEEAAAILAHRKDRIATLREELQQFAAEKRAKDANLQDDLDDVGGLAWFIQVWKRPQTERD